MLAGPAGSGKSTLAARHFEPDEIVSSDECRAIVGRGEADMQASPRAFELFYSRIAARLAAGRLVVADSTALAPATRQKLLALARRHEVPATLVVLAASLEACLRRNAHRTRRVPERVIRRHVRQLEELLTHLDDEGFDRVYVLPEDALRRRGVRVRRVPLPVERPETGPFDIIGDVHGCFLELVELLERLGYRRQGHVMAHPGGRQAVFLGDLTDRGPYSVSTMLFVEAMVRAGAALYVPGNHCRKLYRWLTGHRVLLQHGIERTVRELEALPAPLRRDVSDRFRRLYEQAPPYMILDGGRLVVVHAGIKESMIGRMSRRVTNFCLFGDATGERTPDGRPVRRDWARDYRGHALVVYGHTPVETPVLRYNTINIDQGCVFGGFLTAFRYPEGAIVQVRALAAYDPRPNIRTWEDYAGIDRSAEGSTGLAALTPLARMKNNSTTPPTTSTR
ncbi:MAG TPA: AAA family ATPase [Limnochordales bacterium]